MKVMINYDVLEDGISKLMYENRLKSRHSVYKLIAEEMKCSSDNVWKMITKEKVNGLHQLSAISSVLGISPFSLLTVDGDTFIDFEVKTIIH